LSAPKRGVHVGFWASRLRGLLLDGSLLGASQVAGDVSGIVGLLGDTLELVPSLAGSGGSVLAVGKAVAASTGLAEHALDESALGNAGAEEDSVDNEEDPRALLEDDSRSKDAEPKGQLESCNERHAGIIVVLDEAANGLGDAGGGGLLAGRHDRRRLESGEEDAAGVGGNVEDAVDGEGQESQGHLAGEEPDKGHGWGKRLAGGFFWLFFEELCAKSQHIPLHN
jgi:hypothetical protein